MYVLSFPGFHWFKVPVQSTPRTHHACTAYGSSMIVSGGLAADGDWTTKDVWPQGLGIFNMSSLQWQTAVTGPQINYQSNYRYSYTPSKNISDWYINGYVWTISCRVAAILTCSRGMKRVRWDDTNERLFVSSKTGVLRI